MVVKEEYIRTYTEQDLHFKWFVFTAEWRVLGLKIDTEFLCVEWQ
jgi:hypothetical protein